MTRYNIDTPSADSKKIMTSRTMTFLRMLLLLTLLANPTSWAESQEAPYPGITDPFGDPSSYEFAEDEKADKEFFHLGRFIMIGFDIGFGVFTGGLGRSADPGAYFGGRILYFFDKSIAFEAAVHFANHLDKEQPTPTTSLSIDTNLMPVTFGFRYYFDTKASPKAIALANPYLAAGGGAYIRSQTVIEQQGISATVDEASSGHFGAYFGGGVEFPIYRKHLFLGLDMRYHFVFFNDEDSDLGGNVTVGERGGDYFTPVMTLTYSF